MNMDYILDYLRLVSYTIIILSSLRGIFTKKYSNFLYLGDIIIAFGLLFGGTVVSFFNVDRGVYADIVLTPVSMVWAVIHFCVMVKQNELTKKRYKSSISKGDKK